MLQPITQTQYEDILFNPNLQLTEKHSWSKKERTVKLLCNGKVLAVNKTGRNGNTYKGEV